MFLERIRLDGKVVMVVGAGGGGNGTATSIAAAEAGADVVGLGPRAASLEDVERRVKALGRRFLPIICDARQKADVTRAVDLAVREFGAIHCLANVVGGMQAGQDTSLLNASEQLLEDAIALNLRSHFLTCQAVARTMVERKISGSIVNVASLSGFRTDPSHGPYSSAKRGVIALSQNMALEWSEFGIRVNVVTPGSIRVPRHARIRALDAGLPADTNALSFDDVATTVVPYRAPLGRWGTPVDIASAILFFFSDLSIYVTGQALNVDGGASVRSVLTGDAVRQRPNVR